MRYSTGWILIVVLGCAGAARAAAAATDGPARTAVVEAEEIVTAYQPPNNGAGPLWCYGSTVIARRGQDVYLSVTETGKDVPLLCNTRWQLWHRDSTGWRIARSEADYRQREPCPLAIFESGRVFLSANPSTEPPGVKYGPCEPLVLEFDARHFADMPETHHPAWADGASFTDHSYRGFAADGTRGQLLLLNINSQSGEQFVSFRDAGGRWHARGRIRFPIRSCYPQVAIRRGAAHVMAIGDIVEPVEEWRTLKFEKLNRQWDYVFRRLFYAFAPDIGKTAFGEPIEIDSVEKTCGYIRNLDLHVDENGAAHLLYLKQPHQYAFVRDKYFPGEAMTSHLEYVVVEDGTVKSRRTLVESGEKPGAIEPSFARFHVSSDGALHVILAGVDADAGGFGNFVGRVTSDPRGIVFVPIVLEHPFRTFFTNTTRGGSAPSDLIDMFGIADDAPNLRYARIRLGAR